MPTVPIEIAVSAERRAYRVLIGRGTSRRLPGLLRKTGTPFAPLVVSCARVWALHGERLRGLRTAGPVVLLGDGERAKTLASVRRIYQACVESRLDRGSTIVAFGGGVVGDVAGFAAASYLRGLDLVQVPTTLLSQVDSAIGGKVGVNLPAGKNLVGAFHPPVLVVCDPDVLGTLPPREFRAGLYEVIKYGVIASRTLFERLEKRMIGVTGQQTKTLTSVIADCCRIKAAVVMQDEREVGPRRVLNFGHTLGHALEAVTGYRRFRHGEGVGYGMIAAAQISAARGAMTSGDAQRVRELVLSVGSLPRVTDLSAADVVAATRLDKKVVGRRLHFVLATGIGSTAVVTDVTSRELRVALRSLGLRA